MRNAYEQIRGLRRDQLAHRLEIGLERPNASRPGGGTWRRGSFRPVTLRPFRRGVLWVAAELENVGLRQPQVLQNFPGRMLHAFGTFAPQCGRQPLDYGVEMGVRSAASQKIQHM